MYGCDAARVYCRIKRYGHSQWLGHYVYIPPPPAYRRHLILPIE